VGAMALRWQRIREESEKTGFSKVLMELGLEG
jgi:hypothetical protein